MNRPIYQNPHLDGKSFSMPGENGVGVLLFHGLTSTTVEVRPLAEYLNQAGFSVVSPLLPGHGTTPDDVNTVHRKQWLETAEQSYQVMKSQVDKVIIGGASMGGLLALHLAETNYDISGLVLFAPAIHINGQWKAQFLAPFVKIMPKPYLTDESPTPDVYPWQGYTVVPVPAVAQFHRLQKQVRRGLSKVRAPVLIFQGVKDTTIVPSKAAFLYNKIPGADKKLIWLENSGHTLLLGLEHPLVYQETKKFIDRVTK
ncbi:MAG: alpha/beta hydrolase [Bellilinea sp.]